MKGTTGCVCQLPDLSFLCCFQHRALAFWVSYLSLSDICAISRYILQPFFWLTVTDLWAKKHNKVKSNIVSLLLFGHLLLFALCSAHSEQNNRNKHEVRCLTSSSFAFKIVLSCFIQACLLQKASKFHFNTWDTCIDRRARWDFVWAQGFHCFSTNQRLTWARRWLTGVGWGAQPPSYRIAPCLSDLL